MKMEVLQHYEKHYHTLYFGLNESLPCMTLRLAYLSLLLDIYINNKEMREVIGKPGQLPLTANEKYGELCRNEKFCLL
jgi:hypothetical protein